MKRVVLFLLCSSLIFNLAALKLDRVILAVDNHPNYIQFLPIVAKAWQKVAGVRPTIALIGDVDIQDDDSLGDFVRFKSIPGIPTWFHAQTIRLLLPTLYPNDVCIISDMDMLPISRTYFVDSIKDVAESNFVVYNNRAYQNRFPMCYLAAKGQVFKEVLRLGEQENPDFEQIIQQWFNYNLGWETDELVFHRYLTTWSGYDTLCTKLNYGYDPSRRICRSNWRYDANKLSGYYYDAHLLRPYFKFKTDIDQLVKHLGV